MPTILDILLDVLTPAPCDFCAAEGDPRIKRVYRDPETGCHYCLPCLEMATDPAEALEDGSEDMEITAMGRAVLDKMLSQAA